MCRFARPAWTFAGLSGLLLSLPAHAAGQAPPPRPMPPAVAPAVPAVPAVPATPMKPAAPAQAMPGQPAPVYPGLESNPFYPGWPWFPARPSASSERPGYAEPRPGESNPYAPPQPPDDKLFSAGPYENHEPLLVGLYELKLREVKVGPRDIVNVRRKMSGKELFTLIESVNADHRIYVNAEHLTARLVQRGLLRPGDRVVGYADGKVYAVMAP